MKIFTFFNCTYISIYIYIGPYRNCPGIPSKHLAFMILYKSCAPHCVFLEITMKFSVRIHYLWVDKRFLEMIFVKKFHVPPT